MTDDHGSFLRKAAGIDMKVGSADGCGADAEDDVAVRPDSGIVDGVACDLVWTVEDGCFHAG